MREFQISSRQAGQRADKYLRKILSRAGDGFLYKMIRKKNIDLNGKRMTGKEILKEGDSIRIWFSEETFEKFSGSSDRELADKTERSDAALQQVVSSAKESLPGKGHVSGNVNVPGKSHVSENELYFPKGASDVRKQSPYRLFQKQVAVIYEDADRIILSKPAGMLSQKAMEEDYSVNDWLRDYLIDSGQITEADLLDFHPAVCNRLDRNTSGLILAGKSVRGLQEWSKLLKERTLKKYYRCMTAGTFSDPVCLVRGWLKKDQRTNRVRISEKEIPDGRPIETEYRVIRSREDFTELEVHLITGRSHQIRAHLASLGHPILGDPKYGDPKLNRILREQAGITHQMLHACRVELPDGRSFEAPLPEEFHRMSQWGRSSLTHFQ